MKLNRFALVIATSLALTACGGGGDGDNGPGDSADVPLSQAPALVQQYAALFNAARSQPRTCGTQSMPAVQPLSKWNPNLQASAQAHADDMAAKGYFSHDRRDGKTAVDFGYKGMVTAENLAGGSSTPAHITSLWLNSPGHCAAIMNQLSNTVVIGRSGNYTVMVFGE
jgi:uncharacterized protein YkwD